MRVPAQPAQQVPGQPRLHSEFLGQNPSKNNNHNTEQNTRKKRTSLGEDKKATSFPRSHLPSRGQSFVDSRGTTRHACSVMCPSHAEKQCTIRDLLISGRRHTHGATELYATCSVTEGRQVVSLEQRHGDSLQGDRESWVEQV